MSTPRSKKPSDPSIDPTPALGKTIQRLRKAYNMSLGELSEQSGVAKSIISQIERNETNPTISTVFRLSRALDTSLDEVLRVDQGSAFLEHQPKSAIPILESEDGLCRLAITGPLNLIELTQWYDFHAKPHGVLESEAHASGTVEHLYVLQGEIAVHIGDDQRLAKAGEALRYLADRPHKIVNMGESEAHVTMILMFRPLVVPAAS